jgi:divalent metal cation (Fe/Co/Zn/Cd) transporter
MRRLLESLVPEHRQVYWRWVGSMFALYVVLMITAAGVFVSHESTRKLVQQPVTTVATDGQRSITPVSAALRQASRY